MVSSNSPVVTSSAADSTSASILCWFSSKEARSFGELRSPSDRTSPTDSPLSEVMNGEPGGLGDVA